MQFLPKNQVGFLPLFCSVLKKKKKKFMAPDILVVTVQFMVHLRKRRMLTIHQRLWPSSMR
jgi:hypothetical protein